MEYIDFAYVLSTSLTPITLISGAGVSADDDVGAL